MTTRIHTSDWKGWAKEIRQVLRALIPANESEDSGLLHNIHRVENEGLEHKSFVLFEDSSIAGHALATWDAEYKEFDIMLYVRRTARRKGYGTRLFNAARDWVKEQGKPYFFFADPVNTPFFKTVDPGMFLSVIENKRAEDKRIGDALELIVQYGGIDGAHHKAWVLDQAVRILAGSDYDQLIKEACNGKDGPDTYAWDTGIAP